MKLTFKFTYWSLVICIIFFMSLVPIPVAIAKWTVVSIFEVKNMDSFQSARLTIPDNAEKIRLTFEIIIDNPSGQYVLMGSLLNEEYHKWEFQETQGLTQVLEFNDVTGTINLSLLLIGFPGIMVTPCISTSPNSVMTCLE